VKLGYEGNPFSLVGRTLQIFTSRRRERRNKARKARPVSIKAQVPGSGTMSNCRYSSPLLDVTIARDAAPYPLLGGTGAVKELDEGGSFGGTGLATEDDDNARMDDVLRLGDKVFPVASDDHIAPLGGVAQDSRIIRPDGKDIAKHHDFVP